MIDRETLERMFDSMHKSKIDTDHDLLWGYFFTDRDSAKLKSAVPELERAGYKFVDLFQAETEADPIRWARFG